MRDREGEEEEGYTGGIWLKDGRAKRGDVSVINDDEWRGHDVYEIAWLFDVVERGGSVRLQIIGQELDQPPS